MAKPCFYIDGKYLTNEEMLDWASKQDIGKIGKILPQFSHAETPFRKTDQWLNLVARRMMRYAAENGFDRIAWTTGEQQADRYDLSKQVDEIRYEKVGDNYAVGAIGKNGEIVYRSMNATANELEDAIGKEITQKIVNDEGEEGRVKGTKVLSGENLKIGGSGMKAFYDGIVPSTMSKLAKPFGAKIENIKIGSSIQQSIPVTDEMKLSVMEGIPMYKIIGEKGAANLDKSEEATIRLDNLRVAKEMEATKTPKEIRLSTGWEKGVDGLWRYEQPDGNFSRKMQQEERNGQMTLGEAWNDEQLFKAYPQLKDIKVDMVVSRFAKTGASFNPETNKIVIAANETEQARSIMVHEIQHAIQHIEGFAKGGNINTDTDTNDFESYIYNSKEANSIINAKKDFYNTEEGKRINEAQNTDTTEWMRLMSERNKNNDDWKSISIAESNFYKETGLKPEEYLKKYPSFNKFIYDNYKNLAGETEARNVQYRINYSPNQRATKLLSETADVAPEDQRIIYDGFGVSESRTLPKPDYKDYNGDVLKFAEDTKKWYDREEKRSKKQAQKEAEEKELIEKTPIPRLSDYLYRPFEEYQKAKQDYIEKITGVDLNEKVGKKTDEVLGKKEWYTFIPLVTEAKEFVPKTIYQLSSTFIPYKIGADGRLTKEALVENLGHLARRQDIAEESMKIMKKRFDGMSKFEALEFIDNMERGIRQSTDELDAYAKVLRDALDNAKNNVQALGTGKLDTYIENYFPHMWGDPKKANSILGKKPLEGSKGWMKKRTIEFTKDGVEKGLIPVSWNPVQLTMLKVRDMERYVMAHETLNELKEAGIVIFSNVGKPEGFEKIDDKIGTVQKMNEDGTFTTLGNYYAAENSARIINNYLSKGLWGNVFYDTFRGLNNTITQVQLGLSAFHIGFTTIDATISKVANGIDYLFQLKPVDALREIAFAPVSIIANPIKGDKLLKAWYGKPSTPEMQEIAKLMEIAGGRVKMDQFYANNFTERIRENLKNHKFVTAGLQVPLSILEWTSKPIMEYIVPRQKLGVFADMAKEITKNHPDYTPEELRIALQNAWSSVDNRLGQLVYDNIFWNKVTKDIAMASVRAVGWNLGSIREIAGAPGQAIHVLWDALHGRKSQETHKVAYVIALIGVQMLISAIYQYIRTGEAPDEIKDYFFPKNGGTDSKGDPQRSSMPTYWKDIYSYSQEPGKTAANKLSPIFGIMYQLLVNKDYYGTRIINKDDKAYQIGLDYLNYFKDQFTPFGIRNVQKQDSKEEADYILPFIGITPAPRDLNMTKAEKRAYEIMQDKLPVGGRTKEQADESEFKRELTKRLQAGENPVKVLGDAYSDGKISESEANYIYENYNKSGLEKAAKKLSYEELKSVYELANDKEKSELYQMLKDKLENKLKRRKELSTDEFNKLTNEYNKMN
jgi:hypothetical protein